LKKLKKINWERKKATRTEYDWAVHGALKVADPKGGAHVKVNTSTTASSESSGGTGTETGMLAPALFVYGSSSFNTRTRLTSLHESFKGYFYKKVKEIIC
jgi:hypothetical protein